MTDEHGMQELDQEECAALLAGEQVGRIGVVVDGQPLVFPVNYVFDNGTVLMRTGYGSLLSGAALGLVAFEIDGFDDGRRTGWSVLIQGVGHDVTDALDTKSEHLQTLEVSPWAPGSKPRLLRIDATSTTGRRFGSATGG
jgi:nitroimidazol reductase NimA-like FMN-containing flavoprotein (pyridoxamine 5'-phosphate oxidase superfamily)